MLESTVDPARVLNPAFSVRVALSKRMQADRYCEHGLPVPETLLVGAGSDSCEIVKCLGLPVVVKPDVGLGGRGLSLCHTVDELDDALTRLGERGGVAQQFVREGAEALRVVLVRGELIASAMRIAPEGEWLANVMQGARCVPFPVDNSTLDLARSAMDALGLSVAGVDVILTSSGPILLECNQSPGLAGVQTVSNFDVAARMAKAMIELV